MTVDVTDNFKEARCVFCRFAIIGIDEDDRRGFPALLCDEAKYKVLRNAERTMVVRVNEEYSIRHNVAPACHSRNPNHDCKKFAKRTGFISLLRTRDFAKNI